MDRTTLVLRWVLGLMVAAAALAVWWLAYVYASTPEALRHPAPAHYHFRLQVVDNGRPVNFADDKYQTPYTKDVCSALLTRDPVHFHDHTDQLVHIHWNNLSGGILLKDYGWNLIGGTKNTLGYRFDQFPKLIRVAVHGQALPRPPAGAHYYVYTGEKGNIRQRSWKDFLHSDLHTFLMGSPAEQTSHVHDFLGNVVIFAQKNPPTAAQVADRFNHLVPLPETACAG